ncbi:Fic family protein [Amycolatopsis sp. WAC 01376]|uniref:Fic family protein n=1 Tax=Amycolatopsis sp. WAC 01376 TaxID=2203195 RepID=UPI000F77C04F|nr:Fic family protein [Amycolatopsis sp. WAC 01376]RSM60596.1 Fic family protein [Amycolatopsis sp. WAC 01376]
MSAGREYESSHPWITFKYQVRFNATSAKLGEAYSKCRHLAGTPLQPSLAKKLAGVYLVKGAVATAAIEGNTLREDEVHDILEGRKELPPTQQYLEQEIRNVLHGLQLIDQASRRGESLAITAEWIKAQNKIVLDGLEVEPHVVPGEFTVERVAAGNYRGAPPADVEFLIDQLCDWIAQLLDVVNDTNNAEDLRFTQAFYAATLAHLYIAWIHPFGDGNGRTARMVECAILAHCGIVPWVSSNLLSDHYNRTRSRYYQKLSNASRHGDVDGFISYSAAGYVDMLREQIHDVQLMQRHTAWVNYVHQTFRSEPTGETYKRRCGVVLALPPDQAIPKRKIPTVTAEIAGMYATRGPKTLSRDLHRLEELGLVVATPKGYIANTAVIDAFLPMRVK